MTMQRSWPLSALALLIAAGIALGQNINPPPIFNEGIGGGVYVKNGSSDPDDPTQAPGNYGWDSSDCYWGFGPLDNGGGYWWSYFPTLYYQDKVDCSPVPVAQLPLYDLPNGIGPVGGLTLPTYVITTLPVDRLDRIREIPLECSPTRAPVTAAARYKINLSGSSAGNYSGALFYVTAFYDSQLFRVDLYGRQYAGNGNYSPGAASLAPYVPRFVVGSTLSAANSPIRYSNITALPEYVKVSLQPGRSPHEAASQNVQIKVDVIRWRGTNTANYFNPEGDAFRYLEQGRTTVQVFNAELPPDWGVKAPVLDPKDALPISTLSDEQRRAAEFSGFGAKAVNDLTADLPKLKVGHNRFYAGRTLQESLGNDAYWHTEFTAGSFVTVNIFGVWCAVDDLPGWTFSTAGSSLKVHDPNENLDYYYENLNGGSLGGAPLKLRYVKRGTTVLRTYNYNAQTVTQLDSQTGTTSITYGYSPQGSDTVLTVTGQDGTDTRTVTATYTQQGYLKQAAWGSGGPVRQYVYNIEPSKPARDGRILQVNDAAGNILLHFTYDDRGRLTQTDRGSGSTFQILNAHEYETTTQSSGAVTGSTLFTRIFHDGTSYQAIWRQFDTYNREVQLKVFRDLQQDPFDPETTNETCDLTTTVYRDQSNPIQGISNYHAATEKRLPSGIAEYTVFVSAERTASGCCRPRM